MAIMVMRTCEQVEGGLPADVKSKMYFNIVLDFGIGLVPFLGDIADAVFRANTRNAVELEKFLRAKGAKALKAQGHSVPAVDPSDPNEYDRILQEERGPPPAYDTNALAQPPRPTNGHNATTAPNSAPQKGGWFSGFSGRKTQQADVERDPGNRMEQPLPAVPNGDTPQRKKSTLQKNRT